MGKKHNQTKVEVKRRLSPFRLLLAIFMLAGISAGAFWLWQRLQNITVKPDPWFAPYVDVTATPTYPFEQHEGGYDHLVLAFIVSSVNETEPCTPTWGGVYTLEEARGELDLDRRIERYRQLGGDIAISFGGLLNDELAVRCEDHDELMRAYQAVIDRYQIDTIDLDLENNGLTNKEALKRRADAIVQLQKKLRSEGQSLAVWLTLPVAPFGMTEDGTNAVAQMLASGVDLAGVNVMTMDYGQSKDSNQTMQQASERALIETHRQLGILYSQAGITLDDISLWAKIGATPMIGQNDVVEEIFTLEDAQGFNAFATARGVTRMSMWSANRDIQCGDNYVTLSVVSDSCSGVKQDKFEFANKLSKGFYGSMSKNSSLTTKESQKTEIQPDNPDESPYQIWTESGVYLEGTKVVWHGHVYQAKWWTKGDLPDNPVLQSWETPWQLIGPVMPGEKPIPQPTLEPGRYPEWTGTAIYDEGDIVLFDGVPYEAKWWTQGDSPAASASNPDSSPWRVLTREQIEKLIEEYN